MKIKEGWLLIVLKQNMRHGPGCIVFGREQKNVSEIGMVWADRDAWLLRSDEVLWEGIMRK